ncbi:hypothetical protein NW756_004644 [Fusarium oxysporum]|nr:hypothetical protein NW763_011184 [Fusarium oxysporum]KAJ4065369.1 hypothetical protein NW753_003803 [Fusarium oxysporum]KAJ4095824.1 hypothetical protein NW756_004644 [Fusarium oxysporum]
MPEDSERGGPQPQLQITNRLVEDPVAMQSSSYTALSYTWGRQKAVDNLMLLTTNKAAREQGMGLPGSLEVYKQAFEITKALGEEFIWIDSLCIMQDKESDRKVNFENDVQLVYQNARVTICAIFGEPTMDPLQQRQVPSTAQQVKVADNKYCIAKRLGFPAIDIGTENREGRPFWATRGWTFQERVLATS